MLRLSNIRILYKILLVIALLSAIAGALTYQAISAMTVMDSASARMSSQATNSRLIAQLSANLMAISRENYRMAADPRPATLKEASQSIVREREDFAKGISEVRAGDSGWIIAELDRIQARWDKFQSEVDEDVDLVTSMGANRTAEQSAILSESMDRTLEASQTVRQSFVDLSARLTKEVERLEQEANAAYRQSETSMITLAIAGILGGVFVGFLLTRFGIVNPIRALMGSVRQLADGHFDIEVAGRDRKDEVGEIAQAVEAFKVKLAEEARREAEAKIERDLKAAAERKAEMIRMADDFEGAVGEIVTVVSSASTELQAAAATLTSSAEETSSQSASVASAAQQAAMNVQTIAASIEELSSSATEIGRQAHQSKNVAVRAVEEAERTNVRMRNLRENADKIGAIISLIDEIAEKTNLLALNATIEAARAGEAGRGFAVVANEVKGLAEQTAKATAEISGQIKSMQSSTTEAGEAIASIGETIRDMNSIADAIFGAIGEQTSTTSEVARNIQQTAQGTQEVTDNIGGVTQAAQEASSASAQVLSSANELAEQSSNLRMQMSQFLEKVRTA
ncbi:methyl-accepting chemotaxis protein [Stappia indica]|uniref:HAMP domain-containing protein n=1 Tax=Stappia indica TaxID=538381 RepID=A0A857CC28_9HYPH|nr:methyl-accepting chemotaxis protein [Stappia indica]QGZ36415.1 HAMP domain-containing protein [Stappia indica]